MDFGAVKLVAHGRGVNGLVVFAGGLVALYSWAMLAGTDPALPRAKPMMRPVGVGLEAPKEETSSRPRLSLASLAARPLFEEARRQLPVVAPAKVEAPKEVQVDRSIFASHSLVGIVESDGSPRILIDGPREGSTLVLGVGEMLGAWTFEHLEAQSAVFSWGDERHRLDLKDRSEEADPSAMARVSDRRNRRRR